MAVRIGKVRCRKLIKEYYAEEIDLNINDIRNVDTSKLLSYIYYNTTMNDILSYEVENILKSKNKDYNDSVAKIMTQNFESSTPSLEVRRKQIYEEYSDNLTGIYEKYNIKKDEYRDVFNINNIDTTFLTNEEISKLTQFFNEKNIVEITYKINVHNLIIKELNKIYENFETNLERAIDHVNWNIREDRKNRIKSILLNPTIFSCIIMYIILVVVMWEEFGVKSLLIGIIILILVPFVDGMGTTLYGDKWNDMTAHERDMQIKTDTLINEMYSKRKK